MRIAELVSVICNYVTHPVVLVETLVGVATAARWLQRRHLHPQTSLYPN